MFRTKKMKKLIFYILTLIIFLDKTTGEKYFVKNIDK